MRYTLSILLAIAASIANAADFALPVDASWSGATVTLVASRDGTQLGTGSGTIAQLAGGQYKASATIDLSGAGAGAVTVTAVDASGNLAAVGSGYQIDGAGALLDTTPLNSTETQAAAASALAAYDPPTNAELEARTIVAANYATASDLTSVLADTAELQGLFTTGGTLRLLFPGSTIAAASDVSALSLDALTDINGERVPPVRTFELVADETYGLAGELTRRLKVGDARTFAFDFDKDLPTNGYIRTVTAVAISSGTGGGVTFSDYGRYGSQAKVRITGVTAGTYVLTCDVVYDTGVEATGVGTLIVVE